MNVIRWSPRLGSGSRDLMTFQDEVNRLFDGFLGNTQHTGENGILAPPVDVEETPEEFIVRADLPGVSQKDVKVSLMGDTLTIRGSRTDERKKKDGSFHRIERTQGSFERSFTFGTPVKTEGVSALARDGVLEVRVPKADEAKLREIEVKVAS
jgi:HSP20 family protein